MIEPEYSETDKLAMMSVADAIAKAKQELAFAAFNIKKIARHDPEYGGYNLEPFRQVMWLVGEDGAGAVADDNGEGDHMSGVIKTLRKAAS